MAIFELAIADEDVERVFNAVCGNNHWDALVVNPAYIITYNEDGEEVFPVDENGNAVPEMVDNPETQGDFTHRMVRGFLSEHVKAWETKQAKIAATESIDTTIEISDPTPS